MVPTPSKPTTEPSHGGDQNAKSSSPVAPGSKPAINEKVVLEPAAKRFFRKALERHGRPDRIILVGSQTNREAIVSCDTSHRLSDRSGGKLMPIRILQSQYLNNCIEQDHRRIKGRVRPMLGFKSPASANSVLFGIEIIHMMQKQQAGFDVNPNPSLAEQFQFLAG